jgi:hypothetical protein
MRPRYWLPRYHGAFADRRRNRARIVPKRIQELPSLSRMSSCIASPACTATSPFTNGWNAQHGMRREMSYVPAARFVTVYRPSGLVIEWNVERFPASGQTPKSLKLQFKFGDLGV